MIEHILFNNYKDHFMLRQMEYDEQHQKMYREIDDFIVTMSASLYGSLSSDQLSDYSDKIILIEDEVVENNEKHFVPKYHSCPSCGAPVKADECAYCGIKGLYEWR